jgi:copper chaperone CopZ
METLALKIGGMHCEGCAETVTALLLREPGVRMAEVSFKEASARILYEPKIVTAVGLVRLVERPGYHVFERT